MGHLSLFQGPSHDKGLLTVVFWWLCGPWWQELSRDIGQTNCLLYYVARSNKQAHIENAGEAEEEIDQEEE